jgi:hypothetical protein
MRAATTLPSEFLRAYLLKGAFIWLTLRLFVTFASDSSASVPALLGAGIITAILVLVDAEIRQERLFLANLGIGRRVIVGVCLVAVATVEIGIAVLTRAGFGG